MKKLLLTFLIVLSSGVNSQNILFQDSFETYNDFIISGVGNWITLDIDGSTTYAGGGDFLWDNKFLPQAFQVFNPSAAGVTNNLSGQDIRNFDPRPGSSKYMGSWAAVMPGDGEGGSGPNNDWLISPPIALGASQNQVKFWVKSLSTSYGLETYRVGVYVGSGVPTGASDFTFISGGSNLVAPYTNWEEKTFGLDSYSNQTIRIGILCNSVDRYFLMVDDFSVTSATLSAEDFFAGNLKVFPNPANDLISLSSQTTLINQVNITDINGRVVFSKNINSINQADLNISNLQSGIYFMLVETDLGKGISKFIKN